jgi:hypothetical protein
MDDGSDSSLFVTHTYMNILTKSLVFNIRTHKNLIISHTKKYDQFKVLILHIEGQIIIFPLI